MVNKLKLGISCWLFLQSALAIQAQTAGVDIVVKGVVFEDKNGNGLQDKGEPVLKDILLSNGVDIVSSDKKGKFVLSAKKGQSIFPILPSAYKKTNVTSKVSNANFLYLNPNQNFRDTLDYAVSLTKVLASKAPFAIGAIGDIQVDSEEEVTFAAKSIFKELAQRNDLTLNLMLGDLVNNKMELLADVKELMEYLPQASWTLVGNHDRHVENPMFMNDVFNQTFGADRYAFNQGDVHFVVLNNVYATGKNSYEGRVDEEQLLFLKNDLKHVPKQTTIVISQHIPMAHTRNRDEIFNLLAGYERVLILTGHTHTVNRYFFANTHIQEIGVGATCGTWWRGEKNSDGVPDAVMQCGTPRGYFTIHFTENNYAIQYKAVGLDAHKQASLVQEEDKLVANVYAGSDSTEVKLKIDEGEWQTMTQTKRVDPYILTVVEKNKSKVYPTLGNSMNPVTKRASTHIWELPLPKEPLNKIRKVTLVASDRYGLNITEEFIL